MSRILAFALVTSAVFGFVALIYAGCAWLICYAVLGMFGKVLPFGAVLAAIVAVSMLSSIIAQSFDGDDEE